MIKKKNVIASSGVVGMGFWFVKVYHATLRSVSSVYSLSVGYWKQLLISAASHV